MHQREIKSAPSSFVSPPSLFAAALGIVWEFLLWCTWRNTMRLVHTPAFAGSFLHIFLTISLLAIVKNTLFYRSFYSEMSVESAEFKDRLVQLGSFAACLTVCYFPSKKIQWIVVVPQTSFREESQVLEKHNSSVYVLRPPIFNLFLYYSSVCCVPWWQDWSCFPGNPV